VNDLNDVGEVDSLIESHPAFTPFVILLSTDQHINTSTHQEREIRRQTSRKDGVGEGGKFSVKIKR